MRQFKPSWKCIQIAPIHFLWSIKPQFVLYSYGISISWNQTIASINYDLLSIEVFLFAKRRPFCSGPNELRPAQIRLNWSLPWQNGRHFAIWNAFLWMKHIYFDSNLFLKVQLAKISFGLGNGLAPNRRQAITCTKAGPFYRRIYAALGGDGVITWLTFYKHNYKPPLHKHDKQGHMQHD